ncbi:MAG TPA: hypothetical protein VGJ80_03985 [Gemmatimonadales bacterium]|jgi:hypothetical protein
MSKLRNLAVLTATAAIALVAWSCDRQPNAVGPNIGTPLAHFFVFECTPFKMTGGGRIDFPPGTADMNPPASHEYETFGAHVMASGQTDANGNCLADQGALEWIDHRPEWRINGSPLNLHATEITFAEVATDTDCKDGAAHWGGKLRVQNTGQEDLDFTVWDCDNGEPGAGHDGFAISVPALDYLVACPDESLPPAEPTCTLTGGNRQFHPTH